MVALLVSLIAAAPAPACNASAALTARFTPGELLRYRRAIGAESIPVLCDVKKKHAAHAITADVPLADAVEATEFFGADGVIITGAATGKPVELEDLQGARRATKLPVLVGSGVTPDRVKSLYAFSDALIVGSYFKRAGTWSHGPEKARCRRLVKASSGKNSCSM